MVLPALSREEENELNEGVAFRGFELKIYTHWKLILDKNQEPPGCAYAWLRRHEDFQPFYALDRDELRQLQYVILDYERALTLAWGRPDFVSAEWLGDEGAAYRGHGRMRLTPHYAKGSPHESGLVRMQDVLRAHLA